MSWWVYLKEDDESVLVHNHSEGGTRVLGGTNKAELHVTGNYSPLFRKALHPDGLDWLHGKQAVDTIGALKTAVATLGTERHEDYWKPTGGNAGRALSILLRWAEQHPHAMWVVG